MKYLNKKILSFLSISFIFLNNYSNENQKYYNNFNKVVQEINPKCDFQNGFKKSKKSKRILKKIKRQKRIEKQSEELKYPWYISTYNYIQDHPWQTAIGIGLTGLSIYALIKYLPEKDQNKKNFEFENNQKDNKKDKNELNELRLMLYTKLNESIKKKNKKLYEQEQKTCIKAFINPEAFASNTELFNSFDEKQKKYYKKYLKTTIKFKELE